MIIFLLLIPLLGLLSYSNTFHVSFIFDDLIQITSNSAIRSFGGLLDDWDLSRIVGYFTFALNYRIHELNVTGYHIFNLAVHLINALLVFWLVSLTLNAPFFQKVRNDGAVSRLTVSTIALFSSLLFVAHPIQTQAVTYTVQRFTSLATLFFLLSLVLYAKWRLATGKPEGQSLFGYRFTINLEVKKALLYVAALISVLLAMLTKQIAFTLPVVIALWEFSFCGGPVKRRVVNLLPFALTLPVIPLVLSVSNESLTSAAGVMETPSVMDYFFTQLRVIVTYLRLLFFPSGQNLDYDYPIYDSLTDPNVFLSFLFLILIAGVAVLLYYRSTKKKGPVLLRLTGFGILWFFITLSVESSFITIADVIYEHRLYLPSVGFFIAIVTGAAAAVMALRNKVPLVSRVVILLAGVTVLVLAIATYERNRVWGDQLVFWEDVVSKSPAKFRPHHNLGLVLMDRGELQRAKKEFELALSIKPVYERADSAHNILGRIYLERGDYDGAQNEFFQAIRLNENDADVHNNLGVLYTKRGELDKANSEYNLAINYNHDFTDAYYNLGLNYIKQERYSDAIGPYLKVVELDPGNSGVHNDLGNLYFMQGDNSKALSEYRAALSLDSNNQVARANIQRLQGTQTGAGAGRR